MNKYQVRKGNGEREWHVVNTALKQIVQAFITRAEARERAAQLNEVDDRESAAA